MQKKQYGIFKRFLLPFCFLGILFFHFFDQALGLTPEGENTENRELAKKPEFRIDYLDPFPEDFDAYFNDHFKWRNQLIESYNRFNYFVLKKSALPKEVVMGKDGWLYHADGTDLFRGKEQFSKSQLEKILKELRHRREFVEQREGKYYLIVVPQKQSIYPEFLPDHILKMNPKSKTENLMEYLSENSDLAMINLIDSLRLKKDDASIPLFYKTDHHWNSYGAFQATQSILKRLKLDFPNLDSLETSAYSFKLQSQPGRVTARMLKLENHLKEDNPVLQYHGAVTLDTIPNFYPVPEAFPYKDEYVITLRSSKTEAPSMMMVRESFGVQIIPILSNQFSKSTYVFDTWSHRLNAHIVENEKPDIYLQMIFERLLDNLLED